MSVTSWFLVSSSGTRHRLPRELIFVGRDDCELMLQSRSVDKQHAVVNYDPNTDEHMVKDLGSLNGTFVNDLRIPDQTYITLKLSDVIRFGYDSHVYILEKSQHKVPEEALKHEKYTSQLQLGIKALEAKAKEKQLQSSERSRDSVSGVKHQDRSERRAQSLTAVTDTPISKPTPLYGQPSWWGEDEDAAKAKQNKSGKMQEQESPESGKDVLGYDVNGSLSDSQAKSMFSYRREPSYFEIPTKEFQQRPTKKPESQVHEVPTKDTSDQCISATPTPPVVQSHASFTIEFDDCTPGKMKIKDHVTKFAFRQQHKQSSAEVPTTPTEVVSAENKVADWLVQSNASMRRNSQEEDMFSINSDPSVLKITKANHRDDCSLSDSGHHPYCGTDFEKSELPSLSQVSPQVMRASPPQRSSTLDPEEHLSHSPPVSQSLSSHGRAEPHQAFVIKFVDENSRKKRSQSFTNSNAPPEPAGLLLQQEKTMKSSSPAAEGQMPSSFSNTPLTQRYTIPLKGLDSTGFQRSGSLRREKTEDRVSANFSSRSSSSSSVRPFSSVGRRSKLTKEFTAELLRQQMQKSPSALEKNTNSPKAAQKGTVVNSQSGLSPISPPPSDAHHQPQTSSPAHQPVPLKAPSTPQASASGEVKSLRNEEEDSLSDAGTYTIETDVQNKELEEARSKIDQVQSQVPVSPGAPKYMSCWASLADSFTESGPSSCHFDRPSQMELSGGARGTTSHKAILAQYHDSLNGNSSKSQRILQPVPQEDGSNNPVTPSIHVHYNPNTTFDLQDGSSAAPKSQDGVYRLTVQDDVEPDSLSDASKSDDASIIDQSSRQLSDGEEKQGEAKLPAKSTSFYIGSEEGSEPQSGSTPKIERKRVNKTFSTATLTKQKGIQDSGEVKPVASASALTQKTQSSEGKEAAMSLIRQESFTKEKPSNAKLPNISSQPVLRNSDSGFSQGASSQDTHSYLKQTEDVLAVLEAKFQGEQSETTPSPVVDSLSGDSDVDTSSTVSQNSNKTKLRVKNTSGIQREGSSASMASLDSNQQSQNDRFSGSSKTEPVRRHVGLRRVGKRGSTDQSDDPQSLPYSDQESSSYQKCKKYTVPLQKEEGKTSRVSQALSRASSLTAPRPTRASMLRRARLGEASDNEGTETEKLSQEVVGAPAKQPQEAKKLSRLDMLAMPRRRAGSFNTPSDSESSSAPQWTGKSAGFSNRSTDVGSSSVQRVSTPGTKPTDRPQKAPLGKTTITRGRSSSAKYASSTASSRRRYKGSDYTSTSDEEYDSNWSNLKHKRSQPSSASHSPHSQHRSQPVVARHPVPRSRDSEEENHEGEAFNNWSAHSAEIARLSQDLAKDLAILAREIHDVAGDGDAKVHRVEHSAVTSAAASLKQLAPQSSETALNQRVHLSLAPKRASDQSSSNHEQNRQQAQNGDETIMDSLALNPVHQVIKAIGENTEQLGDKIKLLFQDRMDIWEEIETKINSESDVPAMKASNKEIARILKELQRVQRQLEVINTVMEPRDTLDPAMTSVSAVSSSSSSSGLQSSKHPSSRDWRTVHSVARRGGGPRPSESVRRAAVTPEDLRKGYLV